MSIVIRRLPMVAQTSLIVITAVGWFVLSNHCALAAFDGAKSAPAHACCHNATPTKAPAKNEQVPCCKTLRATLAKADSSVTDNALKFSLHSSFVGIIIFREKLHYPQSFELDTGPPFSESFAESVLQRSILSHAPPFGLS